MLHLERCPACGARLAPKGSEIRRLRTLAALTQRQLAKLLNVKASHIAYLENERRYPSGALILRWRKLAPKLARMALRRGRGYARELTKLGYSKAARISTLDVTGPRG